MTILQIEWPEEEVEKLQQEARFLGHANVGAYLLTLSRMNRDSLLGYSVEDNPSPEQLAREERLLLQCLDSEGEPQTVDETWWENLRADVEARINTKQD